MNKQDHLGNTPLMRHIFYRHHEKAKALIEQGANLDLQNSEGWTALMFACRCDQPDIANVLAQNGAKLDLQTKDGWTALMVACRYGQPETAQVLTHLGAKLDVQKEDGWTALMLACRYNMPQTAKVLTQNGAKVNLKHKEGWTAIMFACRYDQPETAMVLAQKGAELDVRNKEGWTAMMMACLGVPALEIDKDAARWWTAEGALKCLKVCYVAGANTGLKDNDGDDALARAKKFGDASRVGFLEFVLFSELAKVLEVELKVPRAAIVMFFENEVVTLEDCKELSENELQMLGVDSLMKRKKCVRRFSAGEKQSPTSLTQRISKRLSGVLTKSHGVESFEFDAFLTHDWGEDGSNHEVVSEINQYLRAKNKVTWFDEDRLSGNIALQITKGIEGSRHVVVFITERYMRKLSSEGEDYCREEFLAACRVRGVKNMIACVLEKCMLDTSRWTGPLQLKMAGELYINFSTAEARAENLPRLLERL